jgi:hypothetical protein
MLQTRYGGYLLPPKEVSRPVRSCPSPLASAQLTLFILSFQDNTTSDEEFDKILKDWLAKQDSPLTPDEKAQEERWLKAAGGRSMFSLAIAL